MWVKLFIFILMGLIAISLFSGMFFLVKDTGNSKRTANALTFRVGFSAALLLLLILSASQGWIQPHILGNYDGVNAEGEVQSLPSE